MVWPEEIGGAVGPLQASNAMGAGAGNGVKALHNAVVSSIPPGTGPRLSMTDIVWEAVLVLPHSSVAVNVRTIL